MLDAAGTLITPSRPVADTYADIARGFGAAPSVPAIAGAFGIAFANMPAMAFGAIESAALVALEKSWWRRLVRQVMSQSATGVEDFEAFFEALYGHYASPLSWRLYPEVTSVIESLTGSGYRLALVSNFDSRLIPILEGLGIHHRFDQVVYSTAAGYAKPDTRIFTRAASALGVENARAVHVGDSYEADYLGARTAGMQGLLLSRQGQRPQAVANDILTDLDQLLPRLQFSSKPRR